MRCPYCLKEFNHPLEQRLKVIISSHRKFSDETQSLILRVSLLTTTEPISSTLSNFIDKVSKYSEDEINYGIKLFFQKEMDLKGFEWQYCAGMIQRENKFKLAQEKNILTGVPKQCQEKPE